MKLLYLVTEDWYFVSHRLALAVAARDAGYEVAVVTRVTSEGGRIAAAGIRVIPFEMHRSSTNPFREIATIWRLTRLYRRERPHIAHHVAIKAILYGTIAARLSNHARIVNALTGLGWLFVSDSTRARLLKPAVQRMLTFCMRSGTALVQNPDDARRLEEMGVPRNRIRRIAGSGVDVDLFRFRPEPEGVPVVLLASRLLWDKGVGEFVDAARQLKRRGVTARFVLAGEPDKQNPSAVPPERIAAWVAEGLVSHLGWVADMPELLASIHVFCLPTYAEGLPKALLEAAAAGRAIVTTSVPGCRDVVADGVNGLTVPARDADALAEAIRQLLENPGLRRKMGSAGRQRAEREFSIATVVGETLELYRERSSATESGFSATA